MFRTLELSLRSLGAHCRFWAHAFKPVAPLMAILLGQHLVMGQAVAQSGALSTFEDAGDSALATFNAVARPISIIAIMGVGVAALFGQISWGWVIKIFGGLFVINTATTIADYFGGNAAQT